MKKAWNGNQPIAVVAAGGTGSRMRPATFFVNKHLLPIGGARLMIDEPLEFLFDQGFKKIHLVTGCDHAGQLSEYVQDGENHGFVAVDYAIQPEPAGIADVVSRVAGKINCYGGMLLILGDNYFENHKFIDWEKFDLERAHAWEYDVGCLEQAKKFGQAMMNEHGEFRVVEKPKMPQHSKILTGLYYFPDDVLTKVAELSPSARGELEITGLLDMFAREDRLVVHEVKGKWCDLGEWGSWADFVEMKNNGGRYAYSSSDGDRREWTGGHGSVPPRARLGDLQST